MKRAPASFRAAGLMLGALFFLTPASHARADTTLFLIRHAERMDGADKDPKLTSDGLERARLLRDMLRSVPLGAIYSTDTRRTKDTVKPTADGHHMDIQIYDGKDMAAFATLMKAKNKDQVVLVSGHTNTVPALMKELGCKEEVDIADSEFDNLFVVTLSEGKEPTVLHLHYGY